MKNGIIHPAKTTAAQNEIALSHHSVRGLYFLAVVFAVTIFNVSILAVLIGWLANTLN